MDDSIYRDLYHVLDQLLIWWEVAKPHLTSEAAMRIYALTAAFAALGASVIYAYRLMSELKRIELDAFDLRQKGRTPFLPETITRKRKELEEFRAKQWRKYFQLAAFLFAFGFIVPSIGLFFFGAYYDWLDPTRRAFVALHGNDIVAAPHNSALIQFVLNQLSHGSLMDIFEVFQIEWGQIRNNPSNYPFSLLVILYRGFVGSFALAVLFFLRRVIVIAWTLPRIEDVIPQPGSAH